MTQKFDTEFDAIRAALASKPELTKDLNVSIRNLLRLAEHLQNSGLRMERHGRWSFDGECSECGEFDVQDPFGSAYCPHCGAKMEGGKEYD